MERRTRTALRYLGYGWSVIPVHVPLHGGCSCGHDDCSWPGKHPRVRWQEFTKRLPTKDEVTEWFEGSCYGSNIGVVTGSISKLVVVDVDGDQSEYKKLGLPDTLSAATGGGGSHYFFVCEEPIRSLGQKQEGKRGFASGIDLKAEGGFVVLPPSLHKSGNRYSWKAKRPPAKLDSKMLPVVPSDYVRSNGDSTWHHELLLGVEQGGRSNAVAKLAGRYAYIGLTIEEAELLMTFWNVSRNRPPMPQHELMRSIRAVYDKHRLNEQQLTTISELMDLLGDVERKRR